MKHGSLFSGIGGFDLAAEWMGWENVFHCEWNEFGQKVLKYYWPKAITYEDITKTDFTIHRGKIDVLTGGFPCQPYSVSGKRKGTEDERHLWPEMLRAIREIQPTWVVAENVRGLINWNGGMVFEEVQADLEAEGFEVQSFILPAASANAPHKRDRVWFVANSDNNRNMRKPAQNESESKEDRVSKWNEIQHFKISDNIRSVVESHVTNACSTILQRSKQFREHEEKNIIRKKRSHGATSQFYSGKNWEHFPTQTPICDGDDGLSPRLDSITFPKWRSESVKSGGNAIVPQVAHQIFKTIDIMKFPQEEKI